MLGSSVFNVLKSIPIGQAIHWLEKTLSEALLWSECHNSQTGASDNQTPPLEEHSL